MFNKHRMKLLAPEGADSGNATVEDKVTVDAATAVAELDAEKGAKKVDDDLDAKAELFVRKVTDSVLKGVGDMLNLSKSGEEPEEAEEAEERKPRKRRTTVVVAKEKTILDWILG
jgi:hypothetical protein